MRLTYLGWKKPACLLVAERLWAELNEDALAWEKMWIFVPTQESGVRLQEALFSMAPTGCMMPPSILTPEGLLGSIHSLEGGAVVGAWATRLAWAHVIAQVKRPNALIRVLPEKRSFSWALSLAETCLSARRSLGECGVSFQQMAELSTRQDAIDVRLSDLGFSEGEEARWRVLYDWEQRAQLLLLQGGAFDPQQREWAWAACPSLPEGLERVVFACVPDPLPLVMKTFSSLEEVGALSCECWVHAPEEAVLFDGWGRPRPFVQNASSAEFLEGVVAREIIDYPDSSILLVNDEVEVSDAALSYFSEQGGAAQECSICVCDKVFLPHVYSSFQDAGWPLYISAGGASAKAGIVKLLEFFREALISPAKVAKLLPLCQSEVLACALGIEHQYNILKELDRVCSEHLPEYVLNLSKLVQHSVETSAALDAILKELDFWKSGISVAVLSLVARLQQRSWAGMFQTPLLENLCEATEILSLLEKFAQDSGAPLLAEEALFLLLEILKDYPLYEDRAQCALRAQDWLELIYEPARYLVLVGVHEGCVPDNSFEDTLLPESLKMSLHLRGRSYRYARDHFMMKSFIESRRSFGGVRLIVARQGATGQPCLPSSLLFCCSLEELPSRALMLFKESRGQKEALPYTRKGWVLSVPPIKALKKQESVRIEEGEEKGRMGCDNSVLSISPTKLRDFLSCPKRFFLGLQGRFERLSMENQLPATVLGNIVHELACLVGPEGEYAAERDSSVLRWELQQKAKLLFEQRMGQSPDKLALPLQIQYKQVLQRLAGFARIHCEQLSLGWRVFAVEKSKIWRPWADLPLEISLRMDRIEYHEKMNVFRVIDLKTRGGKKIDAPQEKHLSSALKVPVLEAMARYLPEFTPYEKISDKGKSSFMRWRELQLPLYVHALNSFVQREYPSARVVSAAYLSLPVTEQGAELSEWAELDAEMLENALLWVRGIGERLLSNDIAQFPAAEELGWPVPEYSPFTMIAPEGIVSAFGLAQSIKVVDETSDFSL